jgi:transcription antitermination protein NusB
VQTARRSARELALFTLLHPDRVQPNGLLASADIPTILADTVKVMTDEAQDTLQNAAITLQRAYATLQELEWDDPNNTESALNAPLVAVVLPKTDEMRQLLEQCLKAADQIKASLAVPNLAIHLQNPDTVRHATQLVQLVQIHLPALDERLNGCMDDWRVDRLYKIDACLLRLALAEMMLIPFVDAKVSINEAIELAKLYSSDDSYRLINGVLAKAFERSAEPLAKPEAAADEALRG